jgi:hypothetical protein
LEKLRQESRCGAIRVARLAELGIPPRTAYRRCKPDGPWQRPLPGIVLLTNAPPTRRQLVEAALLYAGPKALVSGLEACRRHGLHNLPATYGVHLLIPEDHRLQSSDYVVVERTKRLPPPVVRDRVPLAPVARSVLDACRRLKHHDPIRALIIEAVQRSGVSPRWLLHELEVGSQRGTAIPRAVLRDVTEGARSVAEVDAMRVWERTDLPRPRWNVPVRDASGTYIGTPDAWFAEVGLAWEIDSYEFHFERTDYANTVSRNTRYAAAGIAVVQTLPTRLRTDPTTVAAELTAAYRAAEARTMP